MEFRLTYDGELLADSERSAAKRRSLADHKHEIRKRFHPQLTRLWDITPFLRDPQSGPDVLLARGPELPDHSVDALATEFSEFDYRFVPLVTQKMKLLCGLEILFLRNEPPGAVLRSGDLDNRLKTLFDALRKPARPAELGQYVTPATDEDPFFCLLEDDSLITKVSVETDTLLEAVKGDPNDVRVTITVRIRPYQMHVGNMMLG
jgi:hypothetical protein